MCLSVCHSICYLVSWSINWSFWPAGHLGMLVSWSLNWSVWPWPVGHLGKCAGQLVTQLVSLTSWSSWLVSWSLTDSTGQSDYKVILASLLLGQSAGQLVTQLVSLFIIWFVDPPCSRSTSPSFTHHLSWSSNPFFSLLVRSFCWSVTWPYLSVCLYPRFYHQWTKQFSNHYKSTKLTNIEAEVRLQGEESLLQNGAI